jgi:hypothetical protein
MDVWKEEIKRLQIISMQHSDNQKALTYSMPRRLAEVIANK